MYFLTRAFFTNREWIEIFITETCPKLNAKSNPADFSSAFHQQTIATLCDAFVISFASTMYLLSQYFAERKDFTEFCYFYMNT